MLLPALRLRRLLRTAAGHAEHGRWLLAPAGGITRATRRYRSDTLILESIYESPEGRVRAIDFMPPRGDTPDIVRIVEGLDSEVPMRSELVIRFDYGGVVPWVGGWRVRGLPSPGRTRCASAPRCRCAVRI